MKYLLNCRSFISLIVLFSFFDNFGMKKNYDYLFKVLIVGDADVGKTQIVNRYVKDSFVEGCKPTAGIDFCSKIISLNNKKINLQLYDTSGQKRFSTIVQTYYKGATLIVFVYAIDNKDSFDNIPKWVEEVKIQNENAKFLLVGNKLDLEEERDVSTEDAKKYAEENNIGFIEVSAKTGDGIKDMFEYIISELLEDMKKEENKNIEKDIEFNKHEINNSQNDNNNQKKNHIEKKNFPFCDKYCSCCPCLKKSEGNVKNIEPVIF